MNACGQSQGHRAHGSSIRAVRSRPPERQVNTESTDTYVIHDEEHTWKRYSHPSNESQESTHSVAFNAQTENTAPPVPASKRETGKAVDPHRVAVGVGPSKRTISPTQHKQEPVTSSVLDRLYRTDVALSVDAKRSGDGRSADALRHGSDRPF